MQVFDQTSERLRAYHPFPEDIIECVAGVAADQADWNVVQFLDYYSIPSPKMEPVDGCKPISVLQIVPNRPYDPAKARVMRVAMGNGLMNDNNQVFQAATAFAADPTVQMFVFGNPGEPGQKEGILSVVDSMRLARGETRWAVDASMRYLASKGITKTEEDGYSYGTLATNAAALYAELYDMQVTQVTNIEPADVKNRGPKLLAMASLGLDFRKTAGPLHEYIDANGIDAFIKARGGSTFGMAGYVMGLLRGSNLARSSAMANNHHEQRATQALNAQPEAHMHEIWGSESELTVDALMQIISGNLQAKFPGRYASTRILGQKHTMVNDLALQSAIWLTARRHQ